MAGSNAAGLILILKDGKPRQEIDLVRGQSLSMGKHPSNSIILPDKGIRSEHVTLQVGQTGQVRFQRAVFDCLGHKNVLVNGQLEQGPVPLKDGDLIEASIIISLRTAPDMQKIVFSFDTHRHMAVALDLAHSRLPFVYYSKSAGHSASQGQLQVGAGPSQLQQSSTHMQQMSLPQAAIRCVTQHEAKQLQFAAPPAAPPCPPLSWLSQLSHTQQGVQCSQPLQAAPAQEQQQPDQQATNSNADLPTAPPPQPPPLPPLPWLPVLHSKAAAAAQCEPSPRQQQQREQQPQQRQLSQQHNRVLGTMSKSQTANALPAPPLPPLPWLQHASQRAEVAAAESSHQHFSESCPAPCIAAPPVVPPLPPRLQQSKMGKTAQLCTDKAEDAVMHQPLPAGSNRDHNRQESAIDMHGLIAQQAAAAALRRQEQQKQSEKSDSLPQAEAVTAIVTDQLASLEHQLSQKCAEAAALQEQNTKLQAQVSALQQQLASSSTVEDMHWGQTRQHEVPEPALHLNSCRTPLASKKLVPLSSSLHMLNMSGACKELS
ncbi:hypothetical protein MMC14_010612 [Varicellaria rhodocarpa]|nr:hypothetical protein [Varicellaria rhodocarpa]